MYLQTFLDELSYGELAGLYISTNLPTAGILTVDHRRILSLMNNGLLDMYSRIMMKEKEFDLYQRADRTLYPIRTTYMGDPNAGNDDIFIDNTGDDPPAGDIIRWLEAYDADGNEVFIDSPGHPYDLFTTEYDVLKITQQDDVDVRIISLVYQAAYPKIDFTDDIDMETFELDFPLYIARALRLYVASFMYSGKANKSTEKGSLSSQFLYQYETEIHKIQSLGLVPDKENKNSSFENNRWV